MRLFALFLLATQIMGCAYPAPYGGPGQAIEQHRIDEPHKWDGM